MLLRSVLYLADIVRNLRQAAIGMPSEIKTVTCKERINRLEFLLVHGPHTSPNDIVPLRRQLEIMMNSVFKVGCRDCLKIQGSLIDDISAILFRFSEVIRTFCLLYVGVGATVFW